MKETKSEPLPVSDLEIVESRFTGEENFSDWLKYGNGVIVEKPKPKKKEEEKNS